MKHKGIIIAVLTIVLISMACVSASDAPTASVDTKETGLTSTGGDIPLAQANDGEIEGVETNLDVLSTDSGNFSGLTKEIGSGGNVTLKHKYYTYDFGDTIEITRDGSIIDGNGAVIDMEKSKVSAFTVTASNVTIKNLTIRNLTIVSLDSKIEGGAIYLLGNNISVINCNFTNIKVWGFGSRGGAVYFCGNGELTNCNFVDNKVTATDSCGGAAYFGGNCEVTNCSFTNNCVDDCGGAIWAYSGSVENCNFTGNKASSYGGAVFFDNNGTATNCNFTDNKASSYNSDVYGGAIYFGSTYASSTVTDCNFFDNEATGDEHGVGGAIAMEIGSVTNCNFTDNRATGDEYGWGGAIYIYSGSVENCNFVNNVVNSSNDGGGGAICICNDCEVTNCNFTNNKATGNRNWGGAILFKGNGTATNCNFVNNSATRDGGAIEARSVSVKNCNFTNNSAQDGGAIYFSNSGNVTNCNFTDNKASSSGGAIYFFGVGNVTNCNFTNNTATVYLGTGGAIRMYSGSVENCNFTDNKAYSDGGAIEASSGSVKNCNFANNAVTQGQSYGGAIRMSSGSVMNCNFTGNKATGGRGYGGAIRMLSGSVENCSFTNNFAISEGGAIDASSGSVKNCNFTNNSAGDGGAIRFSNSGNVTNCNFAGNNATTGSAIYFFNPSATKTICHSTFLNNSANAEDLQVVKNYNDITLTFTGNDNLLNAIYSRGDGEVTFINVTYWSASGIANTGNSTVKPSRSNKEAGQNITLEIYDSNNQLVENVTIVTNNDGQATYDFIKLSNGNYTYNAYHSEDSYYTYAEATEDFTVDIGDFNRLQSYITAADSVLTLDRNYTFTIGLDENLVDGIVIDKPITINGNGHTIDALEKARIFYVNASSINITGLTFKNGKANQGGAIYFKNDISNSNIDASFINNTAGDQGGANYFESSVSNSSIAGTYSNNSASGGGANYFNGVLGSTVSGTYVNNKAKIGGANYFYRIFGSTVSGTYSNNKAAETGGVSCFKGVSGSNVSGTYINNTAANEVIRFIPVGSVSIDAQVSNAIFLNNNCTYEIYSSVHGVVVKDSWFGNNASNFMNKPNIGENVAIDNWLFLNATADYDSLLILESSNIKFKLNSTNGTDVFVFDNSKLPIVNLTLTATNGDVDKTTTLDNIVKYKATGSGKGSVTAKIENASYTIYFDNILNVGLSASAENITYLENEILTLTYNNAATGKVNITLKSKNYNKTIEQDINQTIAISDLPVGEYDVTVEYFGDKVFPNATAYAKFTVKKITTEVIPDSETIDLLVDDESRITYTLKPENALGNISFSSDDSKIVSVNSVSGDIVAKGEGLANITVSFHGSENYAASNATVTVNVKKIPTQITVNSSHMDVDVNDEEDIGATLTPADAGNLTYKSSDENIVKVEDGKIIALKEGNATITVSFKGDNKYATAENKTINVTVNLNDASVSVNNKTLDLLIDGKFTIVATTNPEGLNISFVPDDSGVYSVDENGNVVGLREGEGSILIKVGGDGIYAENSTIVNVTVSKVPTEITVLNDTIVLAVSDEIAAGAILTPPDAGNVTYFISNSSVVKVEDGKIIALAEGKSTIIVSFEGNKKYLEAENKTINVAVSKVPTEITVGSASLGLFVGDETVIVASLTPAGAGNVTFTSSNESVVIVDAEGNVIANGKGQANITVSFAGDNKYAASQNKIVTVDVSLNDASVTVDSDTLDLKVGETCAINATINPDTILLNIAYKSSDSSVATVDENGVVTAVGVGTAIITLSVGDDEIYAKNSTTVNVTVSKVSTEITVDPASLDLFVGDETVVVASLTPAGAGNVTFTSSNESVVIVDGEGYVIANGKGQAIITVSFAGDDKYAASLNRTISVDVSLNDASVTVDSDTLDLNIDETCAIKATINPDTILLNITYKSSDSSVATVDENGVVTAVGVGTTIITLSVGDDEIYAENSTNITVTVKKSTTKLTAGAKTFKNTDKTKSYTVTLKDNKGNPIANAAVTLNVNGKTYYAKTNAKGQATFKLTKLTKTGTYTAVIKYAGDKKHASTSVKVKITVKSPWKTISKGSKNHAMVKKIQKALKKNGYYRTYKGHYLKVDGIYQDFTVRAVKQFQKAKGLKVTGKVDEKTAKKLGII